MLKNLIYNLLSSLTVLFIENILAFFLIYIR